MINVADICTSTHALGPGLRSAIWVQGCPIHCKGCIAPAWIPFTTAQLMTPEEAADRLLTNPMIEGITISGGEPTSQAIELAKMIRIVRQRKELHIICFSGYTYEQLLKWPEEIGVKDLLSQIDLLIDGPYIQNLNQSTTFAGSSNQRQITLSTRPVPAGDTWSQRKLEVHIRDGNVLTVGVPPKDWDKNLIDQILKKPPLPIKELI